MQLVDAIKERRSTKKFSGKKVDWRKVIQAIDYARFAPMAGNMCSVKFIIVQDEKRIKKIADACQQSFVGDAGALVVVVSDREKVEKMFDANKKGFALQQAGASIQNLLLGLTDKKIDHCWVGFFDDELVGEVIKIKDNHVIEAVIALGVESKAKVSPKKREKPELETLVFFEEYGTKKMEPEDRVRHDWS